MPSSTTWKRSLRSASALSLLNCGVARLACHSARAEGGGENALCCTAQGTVSGRSLGNDDISVDIPSVGILRRRLLRLEIHSPETGAFDHRFRSRRHRHPPRFISDAEGLRPIVPFEAVDTVRCADRGPGNAERVGQNGAVHGLGDDQLRLRDLSNDVLRLPARIDVVEPDHITDRRPQPGDRRFPVRHEASLVYLA